MEKRIFFSCPSDRSLAAYKDWIIGMAEALGGTHNDDLSEEQWRAGWLEFWGPEAGDEDTPKERR